MATLEMGLDSGNTSRSRLRAVTEASAQPPKQTKKVAVIVLGYNGSKVILPCLKSLFESNYHNIEIIVVDNGSTDATAALVRENFPQATLICTGKNLGFAGGNNVGIKSTDADLVVLVNDDTTVRPDTISEMVRFADSDPDLGIIGCKILYPDGKTMQHAGAAILPNGLTRHYGYGELDKGQFDRVFDVAYVTGAAIAIKREVLDRVGLLDASYFPAYFEEVEYCERARRWGFRVAYLPSAVVHHYESHASVKGSFSFFARYHLGRLRYILKNFTIRKLIGFAKEEVRWLSKGGFREQGKPLLLAYLKTMLKLPEILWARQRDWVRERTNPRIVKSAIDFAGSAFYNRLEGFSPIMSWSGTKLRAVESVARFRILATEERKKLNLAVAAFNGHPTKLRVLANNRCLGEVDVYDYLHTLRFDLPRDKRRSSSDGKSKLLQIVLRSSCQDGGTHDPNHQIAVKGAWVE